MHNGYKNIFRGLILMSFHVDIGNLRFFPAFVGLYLITLGLDELYRETGQLSFTKARLLSMAALLFSILTSIFGMISEGAYEKMIPIILWHTGYQILEMVMFFKILESSVEYLRSRDSDLSADELTRSQRNYTIISVVNIMIFSVSLMFNIWTLLTISSISLLITRIYLLFIFSDLKKRDEPVSAKA